MYTTQKVHMHNKLQIHLSNPMSDQKASPIAKHRQKLPAGQNKR